MWRLDTPVAPPAAGDAPFAWFRGWRAVERAIERADREKELQRRLAVVRDATRSYYSRRLTWHSHYEERLMQAFKLRPLPPPVASPQRLYGKPPSNEERTRWWAFLAWERYWNEQRLAAERRAASDR